MILSDVDGLYSADPRRVPDAELIPVVRELTDDILSFASGKGSSLATGGMATKLNAASICMKAGTDMIIMNGEQPDMLYGVIEGRPVGTRFIGRKQI